jgi:hypothetical protein
MSSPDGPSGRLPAPLSDADRYEMAMSFVQSYLGGQVSFAFPTATEIELQRDLFDSLNKLSGVPVIEEMKLSLTDLEAGIRRLFNRQAAVIYGTLSATEEQRRQAVNVFLDIIWSARGTKRISGEFLAIPNLKAAIKDLESRVARLESLLEELGVLIRALGGGPNPH